MDCWGWWYKPACSEVSQDLAYIKANERILVGKAYSLSFSNIIIPFFHTRKVSAFPLFSFSSSPNEPCLGHRAAEVLLEEGQGQKKGKRTRGRYCRACGDFVPGKTIRRN